MEVNLLYRGSKGDVRSEGTVCVLPAIHSTLALLALSERLERDIDSELPAGFTS